MQQSNRLLLFGLALLLVLTACSGDSGTADGDTNEGTDNGGAASDEGDVSSAGGSAADLEDFSIPGPPVGEAALTTEAEDTTIYTITFADDEFETVRDFYDDWTSSQSDEYQRTEAASGGVTWLATVGDRLHIIALSPPIEGDDLGFVTLTDAPGG